MALNLSDITEAQRRGATEPERMSLEEFKKITDNTQKTVDILEQTTNADKLLNSNVDKMVESINRTNTILQKQSKVQLDTKAILDRSGERKEFKSIGQRIGGVKENFKDFFTLRGFLDKTGIAKRGSDGMFSNMADAREAQQLKAKSRVDTGERGRYAAGTIIDGKKVGGRVMSKEDSIKQFEKDAKEEQELRRKQGDLQRALEKKKREGNLNESQASQLKESKELKKLAVDLKRVDPESYRDIDNLQGQEERTSDRSASTNAESDVSETEMENSVVMKDQLDTLHKIEENTRGGATNAPAEETPAEQGGLLSGLGDKLKGVGGALSGAAKGLIALAASVWIISKAMQNFSEVSFSDFMMGVGAIAALTVAVKALDGAKGGTATLLAMSAALWVTSKAFDNFSKIDFGTFMMGVGAIAALTAGVVALGFAGPMVLAGAAALLAMSAAVWVLSKAFENISESMDAFVVGIERLSEIGGASLIGVAAGIAAIGAAMVAFGASQAIAGMANLVTNFLSIGQDSPLDQLEKISEYGPGIEQAAAGLERLSAAMNSFNDVDADKIDSAVEAADKIGTATPVKKAPIISKESSGSLSGITSDQIASHPNFKKYYNAALSEGSDKNSAWQEASMLVKDDMISSKQANVKPASSEMTASNVYKQSGEVQAGNAPKQQTSTNIVSAPTNVTNNKQSAIIKSPVRNPESSMSSFLRSRFVQAGI